MKKIHKYALSNGKIPFDEWLNKLDRSQRAKVLVRLERLMLGAYGDCKMISKDLKELRFDSGLRIYFYEQDDVIVILLNAGGKQRQSKDIALAKQYLEDYKSSL